MKRILSLFTAALMLQTLVFAQTQCPDTSIHGNGFHPADSSLTPIVRTVAYDQDVQVNIPEGFDTTVPVLGTIHVTIDSIHINSVTGQPSNIAYACNPSSCTINGNTAGCINFTGTTTDPAGQYPLTVNVTAHVNTPLGPQSQTLDMSALGFTYYLTVINAGQLAVTVVATPGTVCSGDSSTVTANVTNGSGSQTFLWSHGGATTSSIVVNPTATTTYAVTVTDGGNTAADSVAVIVNQAAAHFTHNDSLMPAIKFTNTSVNATSYSWDFGDGQVGTDENPSHTYTANGTFTVKLTASNNCGSDSVTADVTIIGVGIRNVENNMKFSVYPNPSTGLFTITLNDNTGKTNEVKVFDLNGKMVFRENFSGSTERQLDLSALPKGAYTLHISSEKGNGVQSLVIR